MQAYDLPDELGHFGPYGGLYVAETLVEALGELQREYAKAKEDPAFWQEYPRCFLLFHLSVSGL